MIYGDIEVQDMSYTVCIFNGNNGTETTYDSFEEAKAMADEVEDGREDRFHPVWYRPSEEVE